MKAALALPKWGRRRKGTEGGLCHISPWHSKSCTYGTARAGCPLASLGGGGAFRHDRVHDWGPTLPKHLSGVAMPLGLVAGFC